MLLLDRLLRDARPDAIRIQLPFYTQQYAKSRIDSSVGNSEAECVMQDETAVTIGAAIVQLAPVEISGRSSNRGNIPKTPNP